MATHQRDVGGRRRSSAIATTKGPPGHPERPERLVGRRRRASRARRSDCTLESRGPRPAETEELLRIHGRDHVDQPSSGRRRATAPTQAGPRHLRLGAIQSFEVARPGRRRELDRPGAGSVCRGATSTLWLRRSTAPRPPRRGRPGDGVLPATTTRRSRRKHCTGRRGGRAHPAARLGRSPRQRLPAQLRDRPVAALRVDAPVPLLPRHRCSSGNRASGRGEGLGTTLNVPLPGGLRRRRIRRRDAAGAGSRLPRAYRPELPRSCRAASTPTADDPLAAMGVSRAGYGGDDRDRPPARGSNSATSDCSCVLEGGYSLTGLREGTRRGARWAALAETPDAAGRRPGGSRDPNLGTEQRAGPVSPQVHAANFPGIGRRLRPTQPDSRVEARRPFCADRARRERRFRGPRADFSVYCPEHWHACPGGTRATNARSCDSQLSGRSSPKKLAYFGLHHGQCGGIVKATGGKDAVALKSQNRKPARKPRSLHKMFQRTLRAYDRCQEPHERSRHGFRQELAAAQRSPADPHQRPWTASTCIPTKTGWQFEEQIVGIASVDPEAQAYTRMMISGAIGVSGRQARVASSCRPTCESTQALDARRHRSGRRSRRSNSGTTQAASRSNLNQHPGAIRRDGAVRRRETGNREEFVRRGVWSEWELLQTRGWGVLGAPALTETR